MARVDISSALARQGANAGRFRTGTTRIALDMGPELADFIQDITKQVFREALRDEQRVGNLTDPMIITDYVVGRPPDKVKPFGHITAQDKIDLAKVIEEIVQLLDYKSPFLTGRYRLSHIIMVNGVEYNWQSTRAPGIGQLDEVQFVNVTPYAKRIEQGWSLQAPRGVYKVVQRYIERKYGKLIYTKFTYRTLNLGGMVTRYIGYNKKPLRQPQRVAAIYPVIALRVLDRSRAN